MHTNTANAYVWGACEAFISVTFCTVHIFTRVHAENMCTCSSSGSFIVKLDPSIVTTTWWPDGQPVPQIGGAAGLPP